MNIEVVAQCPDFLVVNKPSAWVVHNDVNYGTGLATHIKQQLDLAQCIPVHRLDRGTSGLMVFALNNQAASQLSEVFRLRQAEKYYLALSDKKPKKKQGPIKGDMVKARDGSWRLQRSVCNPALSYFYSQSVAPGLRLFLWRIYTGKTHQIRVAMKSLSAPVIGDKRYGGNVDKAEALLTAEAQSGGMLLHAYSLRFPFRGDHCHYTLSPEWAVISKLDKTSKAAALLSPEKLSWPSRK